MPTREETYNHLEQIIKMLRRIQNRKRHKVLFWMAQFVTKIHRLTDIAVRLGHCGTSACALGHMGMTAYFRKLGIETDLKYMRIRFKGANKAAFDYCGEAAKILGITENEAKDLFLPTRYADPDSWSTPHVTTDMVINRVHLIMENYKPLEEVPCPDAEVVKPS